MQNRRGLACPKVGLVECSVRFGALRNPARGVPQSNGLKSCHSA